MFVPSHETKSSFTAVIQRNAKSVSTPPASYRHRSRSEALCQHYALHLVSCGDHWSVPDPKPGGFSGSDSSNFKLSKQNLHFFFPPRPGCHSHLRTGMSNTDDFYSGVFSSARCLLATEPMTKHLDLRCRVAVEGVKQEVGGARGRFEKWEAGGFQMSCAHDVTSVTSCVPPRYISCRATSPTWTAWT